MTAGAEPGEAHGGGVFGARAAGDADAASAKARRLHRAFEPIAASQYFAPEVHAEFQAIGFGPPVEEEGSLPLPDLAAYFCGRAGCMGQVPGEVVVAAFGVFSPRLIVPHVERGWRTATRTEILAARERGSTAALLRVLGEPPELWRVAELLRRAADAGSAGGRFLFAGLRSLGFPGTPWGDVWRGADLVREFRGDSHIAAWLAGGLDPVEAGLVAELYYEMPRRRYHRTRGWTDAELDAGIERLRARGLVAGDPVRFTEAGRGLREQIELATDLQQRPLLEALGDDYEELVEILERWSAALVAAGVYPTSVEQIPTAWGRLED